MAWLADLARVPMISSMRLAIMSTASLLWVVAAGNAAPPGVQGYWLTANKSGIVEIFSCGEGICGKLAWFRIKPDDPNPEALDLKNPDPARRSQSLCSLVFMHGFKSTGPSDWEDGNIYDPESGNTYHGTIRLQPDGTLRLRGYIGISLIGRSEVWTRYTQPLPSCPTR
jgi:uncharacterized protein (DUF2147 family)